MNARKAQVALFVLIGFILLVAVIIGIVLFRQKEVTVQETPKGSVEGMTEEAQKQQLLIRAADNAAERAKAGIEALATPVTLLAQQSSQANLATMSLDDCGEVCYPSVETLDRLLARDLETVLLTEPLIMNEQEALEDLMGITLEFGDDITVETEIADDHITYNVRYPLTLTYHSHTEERDEQVITVPIRLGHLLAIRDQILEDVRKNPDLDLGAFAQYDVDTVMTPYNEKISMVTLIDYESVVDGEPFTFSFPVPRSLS